MDQLWLSLKANRKKDARVLSSFRSRVVKDRVYGRLAHLVEHNPCKVGVNGSSPLSSTIKEKKNDSQI